MMAVKYTTTMQIECILTPPLGTQLFETAISTFWMDENGILCANTKNIERTIEHYKEMIKLFSSFIKNEEKLCFLTDAINVLHISKEVAEYISVEFPKYIKAEAVVTQGLFKTSLTTTFLRLNNTGMPVQLFPSVDEAKTWLKTYL